MVEISLSGSGEGLGRPTSEATRPGPFDSLRVLGKTELAKALGHCPKLRVTGIFFGSVENKDVFAAGYRDVLAPVPKNSRHPERNGCTRRHSAHLTAAIARSGSASGMTRPASFSLAP